MVNQTDIFWISRYDYEPEWRVLPHKHDFFQLFYMLDGAGTALVRDKEIELCEGRILIIPPNTEHSIYASKGISLKTLDTKFNVNSFGLRRELARIIEPLDDTGNQIRQILERIRMEGMKGVAWYRELCNALLVQVIILMLRLRSGEVSKPQYPAGGTNGNEMSDRIRSFIHANFSRDICLKEIGDHVGYTPEYLSKLFSSMMGVSVHHYLMHVRIEHAKELLKYSNLPIKEISFECGFKSIHHFSRAFKDSQGAPPASWREQEQQGVWKNVVISPGFVNQDLTITTDRNYRLDS